MIVNKEKVVIDKETLIYVFAQFFSKIGNRLYNFAIPLLIYSITQSTYQMGVAFLFQTLPILIFSVVSGELISRFESRKILFFTILSQILLLSGLFYAVYNTVPIIYIQVLGFILACCATLVKLLDASIIVELCNKKALFKVNSLVEILSKIATLVGPILAGLIISMSSYGIIFLLDIITFIPLLIVSLRLKTSAKSKFNKKSWNSSAVKYILSNRVIASLLIFSIVINVYNGAISALYVVFTQEVLHINELTLSYIYTIIAIAQIVCSYLLKYLLKYFKVNHILIIVQIVSGIGIIVMSQSSFWIVFLIGSIFNEGAGLIFNIISRSYRQITVPESLFSKVNGIYVLVAVSVYPFMGYLFGIIAQYTSLQMIYFTCGVGLVFSSLIIYYFIKDDTNFYYNKLFEKQEKQSVVIMVYKLVKIESTLYELKDKYNFIVITHGDSTVEEQEDFLTIHRVNMFKEDELQNYIESVFDNSKTKIDLIVALEELWILQAAKIREKYNLSGATHDELLKFRDKFVMKNHLKNSTVKLQDYEYYEDNSQLEAFFRKHQKIVLKEISGSGASNTFLIDSVESLEYATSKIKDYKCYIMESFTPGNVYHCDVIVKNTEIVLINVMQYFYSPMLYKNYSFVGGHSVSDTKGLELLEENTKSVVRAFGINNGVAHIEFFYDGINVTFCEIALRSAGATIDLAIEEMYGISLMISDLKLQLGVELIDPRPKVQYVAWLSMSSARNGILKAISTINDFKDIKSVQSVKNFATVGSEVVACRFSGDYVSGVTLASNEYDNLIKDSECAIKRFVIEYEEV